MYLLKNKLLLTGAVALSLIASPLYAQDNKEAALAKKVEQLEAKLARLEKLLDAKEAPASKAEVAKAEVAAKKAEDAAKKAESAAKKVANTPPTVLAAPKAADKGDEVIVSMSPAPRFETADGDFKFKVGGFFQGDAGFFEDDVVDHPAGTTMRRARLSAEGSIFKEWLYKFETDFADNSAKLTDVFITYAGIDGVKLTAGQFKEPFGMEALTSDRYTTFIERAAPFAFLPDRHIGFQASTNGDNWSLTAGAFGDDTGQARANDEAVAFTARAHIAPIAEKNQVLHVGIAGSRRMPDSATNSFRVESRAENRLQSVQSVTTGNLTNVDDVNLASLEIAGVWDAFSAQAEYTRADVSRAGALPDADFNGWYAQASYFLTGETRNYDPKSGIFGKTKPKENFSLKNGGIGAWEVALRHSELDLNDSPIAGGEMSNNTIGLNWYPNEYFRVLGNVIFVNNDPVGPAATANDDPTVFLVRGQVDF